MLSLRNSLHHDFDAVPVGRRRELIAAAEAPSFSHLEAFFKGHVHALVFTCGRQIRVLYCKFDPRASARPFRDHRARPQSQTTERDHRARPQAVGPRASRHHRDRLAIFGSWGRISPCVPKFKKLRKTIEVWAVVPGCGL